MAQCSKNYCFRAGALFVLILVGAFSGLFAGARKPPPIKKKLVRVEVTGSTVFNDRDVVKILKLKIGRPIEEKEFDPAFNRFHLAYQSKGYLDVRLSTHVAIVADGWVPRISVTEGPIYHLQSLMVQGNREVSARKIKREIQLKPGDPFDPQAIIEGNKRLYASGCFDGVNIAVSSSPGNAMDVTVNVRERNDRFFKGGAGYGTETKERLSAGFEDQNFLGGARRIDIKYTYSGFLTHPDINETRTLEGRLTQPFVFGTRMEGQVSMERTRKFREAFDSLENEIRGSVERRYRLGWSNQLYYRFQGTELTDVSPEADTPSQTSIDAVGFSMRFDTTDDNFLPFKGWRTVGLFEEGMEIFSKDVGFHRVEARVGRFDTPEIGWTFFEGLQSGVIIPRSGETSDVIPINERFFLGGANTVRGYSERSLGPKDDSGDPLGGTFFIVTNIEVRHKIYKKVFGVMFYDIGNLYNPAPGQTLPDVTINSLGDLRQGCGVGIRLHSPVGAIRLEGGYQINPEDGATTFDDRIALHFSIGEVF